MDDEITLKVTVNTTIFPALSNALMAETNRQRRTKLLLQFAHEGLLAREGVCSTVPNMNRDMTFIAASTVQPPPEQRKIKEKTGPLHIIPLGDVLSQY